MLAMMGFLGFLNVYAMRVNLSVAMVCMINQTAIQTAPTTLSPVPGHDINNSSSVGDGGVYNLSYVSGGVNGSASVREKNGGGDQDSETTKCGKQTGNSSLSASEVRCQTDNKLTSKCPGLSTTRYDPKRARVRLLLR